MLAVCFVSNDIAQVTFDLDSNEELLEAVAITGVTRKTFIREAIEKAVSDTVNVEQPTDEKD